MAGTKQFTEMEWIKFLGIEPLSAGAGRAVIRLQPRSVHLNHNGTVNAPILYALATSSPTAFHDIVSGNNDVPCSGGTPGCPSGGGVYGYDARSVPLVSPGSA